MTLGLNLSPRVFASQEQNPPDPGIGVRLLEAPVERRNDPRARRFIVDHVTPGTTFSRDVQISNGTGDEVTVELYAAAATLEGGEFAPAPGREQNELSEWVNFEPATLTLPAQSRRQASISISVPADARPGERYAVALVDVPPRPGGGFVQFRSRVGIRIYLSVGGGAEPPTDFELPAFRPVRLPDRRPAIDIDGCNTGQRAIDLTGDVELTDGPGGTKAGPFPTPNATTLAPDQCHTFTIPLDKELPLGPWDATAKLRSGKEERTAQARITFPKEAGERGKKVETREVTGTLPGIIATGISIFLLLLLAGWLFWFLLKRRKRKKDDEEERGG